jgi:4-hydroxy-tetrahydrodipicolinate reductase
MRHLPSMRISYRRRQEGSSLNKLSRARVALVGLGPIGIEVAKALNGRAHIEILGAADPDAAIAGRGLSEVTGVPGRGPAVDASAAALYARSSGNRGKRDVVVLCTGSRLQNVLPQIEEAVAAGFHVVSTCEELAYPQLKNSVLGHRIDKKAKEHGVGVLGTGVNPGARHGPPGARRGGRRACAWTASR